MLLHLLLYLNLKLSSAKLSQLATSLGAEGMRGYGRSVVLFYC
jgi:hypothetical protein